MNKPVYLTKQAIDELKIEKENLLKYTIPEIAEKINKAKELGDLSENFEYHEAKQQMAFAHGRMQEIEYKLLNAVMFESGGGGDIVALGSKITIEKDGVEKLYEIVGAQEADPLKGKISNESPLGASFLGRHTGDEVEVKTPRGTSLYKVKKIE